MVIETERLLLREMTETDYDALYRVLADSDIMQHYPYTFDEARVRGWISRNIERYSIFGFGLWAVCLKETGEMIGDCGLTMQMINGQIKPEIGYHNKKGPAEERLRKRSRYCGQGLDIQKHSVQYGLFLYEKHKYALMQSRGFLGVQAGRGV